MKHLVRAAGSVLGCLLIAGSAAAAPSPQPQRGDFPYVSPPPGARFVAPAATLAFRARPDLPADWEGRLSFRGDRSGAVTGRWVVSDDGATHVFRPAAPFRPGEEVEVRFVPADGAEWSYAFRVASRLPESVPDFVEQELAAASGDAAARAGGGDAALRANGPFPLPADLPVATVTGSADPTPGSIFLSNLARQGNGASPYLMILGNDGFPEFFRRMPGNCLDFKLQPTGVLSYNLRATRRFYLMDRTYSVIDSVSAYPSGTWADGHELRLLPNGHAVIMIYEAHVMDLSQVVSGGQPDADVVGVMLQELDVARNVVFQWSSFDWMDVTDAADDVDLTAAHIDWTHANAIEVEDNGDFLLSCRNTDEITKISRATGDVIWRLGGKKNQFTFTPGSRGFSHQHAVRRAGANLILFDNGVGVGDSRAVEYRLDEENRIATTVWEYHHDPPVSAEFMGFAERLRNGSTFISWGTGGPLCTEVAPDGSTSLEMELPPGAFSYRTLRFHWDGAAAAPELWTVDEGRRVPTLVFTRFGETVNRFNVYGGTSPEPTTLVGSTEGHTFVPALHGRPMFFRVTEVERNGAEGPWSNEILLLPSRPDHEGAEGPDDPHGAGGVALLQNAPNPFRDRTAIGATAPLVGPATVRIFNVLGQEVRSLRLPAGDGRVEWDGRDAGGRPMPAGVYLYRLEAPGVTETRRMVRVR